MTAWRSYALVALAWLTACGPDATEPSDGPAARLDAASDLARTGIVGTALTGPLVVRVRDADGRAVAGATVTFAITQGNGAISPRVTTTDRSGNATAVWTLGNTLGLNEVTAAAAPVTVPIKFTATATAGPVATVTVTPKSARILNGADSIRLTATSVDKFGNVALPTPTFTARDTTLVSVDSRGWAHVRRRGGNTYVIAASGGQADSALVTVLAPGESICTGVVAPTVMSVGQTITDVAAGTVCIRSTGPGEEYALIPYYNSAVPSATTQLEVRGLNLGQAPLSAALAARGAVAGAATTIVPDDAFELALRRRGRELMTDSNVALARSWYSTRRRALGARASVSAAAPPTVGDLVALNANAFSDGCSKPDMRTGRVVAVTSKAIVIADTANPAGGFTDDEYRAIGVTFDTLVDPIDVAAFGQPTDIDNNGGAILFFTRAVNELTPRGSSSAVLGFFYERDLQPKTGCLHSNVAEMFYLLVPDPNGVVGDARSKGLVSTWTSGTVAHEYQHLINASRRLYLNTNNKPVEETWLNEGLSHIAEELNFYRAAGLTPRSNLGAAAITAPPAAAAAFQTFSANNFARFRRYLQGTESQSPIGIDPFDDDLQTRGAIWSFLRFAADHQTGAGDGTLWYQLVNGSRSGLSNLADALGTEPAKLLRDWAVSVYVDDNAANVDPRFQQPSWNMRSAMPAAGSAFSLFTRTVSDATTTLVSLSGGGVSFLRFTVPAGQDGLVTATTSGQLPSTLIQFAVVRVK